MPARVRVGVGRHAIALGAGHLTPPSPEHSAGSHKGVVVVVTASWHVLCFDHNLKLMWENSLQEEFPRHARVREVAVLVSNATMYKGDKGSVIVGGRVELGDIADEEDPLKEELLDEGMMGRHRGGRRMAPEEIDAHEIGADAHRTGTPPPEKGHNPGRVDRSRHFNYYAFEGATGTMRWKHESEDFHRNVEAMAEQLVPQHNYRLDANSISGHHYGEVACRDFRESVVMSGLPHQWREREDTRLQLAHFRHHRPAKGVRAKKVGSGLGGGGGRGGRGGVKGAEHATNPLARVLGHTAHAVGKGTKVVGGGNGMPVTAGDGAGGGVNVAHPHMLPAHVARARLAPNVIVAHQEEGIEVLHLYSGRTLCKMLLPPPGLHADVNGRQSSATFTSPLRFCF